ncbi:SKP1-like protein 11 [Curcuma longa]|uniref:SKP1-like protein 11 n=1 Tax=Curcuma longa TaxID=136217 RepID=UPI003D9F7EC6
MTKMIKLVSGDGQEIEVEEEVALQSKVIEDMLSDSDGVIPLPLVHSKVLRQILEYCRKHATANSSPLTPSSSAAAAASSDSVSSYCISSKPISDPALSAWDKEFVKLDPSSLYDLFMAANYLDIKGLLNLIAETLADMIRGKEPEQIRQLLDIENDFTPEEEAAIRSKHSWAF